MSNQAQIDEWIQEAAERPSSAPIIINLLGRRLLDLIQRNEELLTENIALRTSNKVEEYEQKISNLEHQLEMLKRVYSSPGVTDGYLANEIISLFIYDLQGQIVRFDLTSPLLKTVEENSFTIHNRWNKDTPIRLLASNHLEELLCVFDSGRTETILPADIPKQELSAVDWTTAKLIEPRGGEELVTILPIGKLSLFDYCTQVSRRGCARNLMVSSFLNHVSRNFIGTGVKQKPDQMSNLFFSNKQDLMVIVTHEGFLLTIAIEKLGFSAEEILRLGFTDYVQTSFTLQPEKFIVVITETGKIIQRESIWLEPAESLKSKGQPIFSQTRREAGTRCGGAVMLSTNDFAACLLSNGEIRIFSASELLAKASIEGLSDKLHIVDAATFSLHL